MGNTAEVKENTEARKWLISGAFLVLISLTGYGLNELRVADVKGVNEKIDATTKVLSQKIDGNTTTNARVEGRVNGIEQRMNANDKQVSERLKGLESDMRNAVELLKEVRDELRKERERNP